MQMLCRGMVSHLAREYIKAMITGWEEVKETVPIEEWEKAN